MAEAYDPRQELVLVVIRPGELVYAYKIKLAMGWPQDAASRLPSA